VDISEYYRPTVTAPAANTSFASTVFSHPESHDLSDTEDSITPYTSFNSAVTQEDILTGPIGSALDVQAQHSNTYQPEDPEGHNTLGINLRSNRSCGSNHSQPKTSEVILPLRGEGKKHFRVRDLEQRGLFRDNISPLLDDAKLIVRWELYRIILENNLEPSQVTVDENIFASNYDTFWKYVRECGMFLQFPQPSPPSAWAAAAAGYEGHSFKVKVDINLEKSGPLFKIKLLPIRPETSCRYQRAFGADRFLYLYIPMDPKLPPPLSGQEKFVRAWLQQWLLETHSFLGRSWQVFYHEPEKAKKKKNVEAAGRASSILRVVLFATSGCDILSKVDFELDELVKRYHTKRPEVKLHEIYDWFLPFSANMEQKFCKAYARISLGLSRTTPTVVFKPTQVKFIRDIMADGSPESEQFNDHTLAWSYPHDPKRVMNDGCALISVGAALEIWKDLDQLESVPSVFQGRIGGAKGIWMLSGPVTSQRPEDREVWIQVSDSQKKFSPSAKDLNDATFDEHRLTFDLLRFSTSPSKAKLHTSFLPILRDRGVQQDDILDLARESLDHERTQLLQRLQSSESLCRWAYKESSGSWDTWNAGFPMAIPERIVYFLQSGFTLQDSPYLAELVFRLICRHMVSTIRNLSIVLEKSVMVLGVADPTGVLRPGEVHLKFSKPVFDQITNECYLCLDNMSVVISRHPALRRSDMQKVQAVFKTELDHLVDVIVFPTKGRIPLAGKLQGGDYDGDMYWVCWENRLVERFRNAPAPVEQPDPKNYRIKVDNRAMKDVMKNEIREISVLEYQREANDFRFQPTFLGRCTNLHEKLCYDKGCIDSPETNACANLHDLLVDSTKNGYRFSAEDYLAFIVEDLGIKNTLPIPAYKIALGRIVESSANKLQDHLAEISDMTHKKSNINDRLFFEILVPHVSDTLRICKERLLDSTETHDSHLSDLYQREKIAADSRLKDEFKILEKKLNKLYVLWVGGFGKGDELETLSTYNDTLRSCHRSYIDLKPSYPEHYRWRNPVVSNCPSDWDLIKASALYSGHSTKERFVFPMAAKELGWIKSHSTPGTHTIVRNMWEILKPKKGRKKALQVVDDTTSSESEYESATEDIEGALDMSGSLE
jgi:hypothetical protein